MTVYNISSTFDVAQDGSGAVALHTLSNGLVLRVHFDVTGRTEWDLVQNKSHTVTLGRGAAKARLLAEIGRAVADFNAALVRLGPSWLTRNRMLYQHGRP